MAGGLDSFDWLKDRIKKPKVLVDLSGIDELKGIRSHGRRNRDRRDDHADRSGRASGHQSKSTVCWRRAPNWSPRRRSATRARSAAMFRRTRAAGTTAAAGRAIAPAATFVMPIRRRAATASTPFCSANRCVAVNPSDSAPALIALDAKFVIRTPKGERVVDAEDYFIGPDIDITRMNILQPGDLLTAIRIPVHMGRRAILF